MEENNILSEVADALLDQPVEFSVEIISTTWFNSLLIKWGIKKGKREFKIYGSTLGSMVKISKELLAVDIKQFNRHDILESNYKLANDHAKRMAKVIALAVVNKQQDPPESLISFFFNNLKIKELQKLFNIVMHKIDYMSFLTTIISVKGIDVLGSQTANVKSAGKSEMSLEPAEIIASGQQSEE